MEAISNPIFLGVLVSLAGGLTRATLGYLNAKKRLTFNRKKFLRTLITTFIGGLGLVIVLESQATTKDLVLLYLGVMGIDTITSKVKRTG